MLTHRVTCIVSESKEPGIQQAVRDALVWLLEDAVADVPAPVWPLGHCEGCIGAGCETVGCPNHGTWGSEVRHPPQRAVEEPDAEVGDIEVTEIDMLESATDSDQPREPQRVNLICEQPGYNGIGKLE